MDAVPARRREEIYFYRFHQLLLVVPARYMVIAYDWLHPGRLERLDKFFEENESLLKPFKKYEKENILKGINPTEMDISLLYSLFCHASGISPKPNSKDKSWSTEVKNGQQPSLGQVLYQLKESRNVLSHKGHGEKTAVTEAELDALAEKQKNLLAQMLMLAGRQANKSQHIIQKMLSRMKEDVVKELRTEGITVEEFVGLARQELLKNKCNQESSLYVEPRLVVKTQGAHIGAELPLRDLFSRTFEDGSRPQVILVTDEAGTGKTSLCQAVFSSWLEDGQLAQATKGYQLVLNITCARVQTGDLHQYLYKWVLPQTTQECEGTAKLSHVLQKTKILWLVDGWNEGTKEARSLLNEIQHSKSDCHTILVTCRPELAASLPSVGKLLRVSFARFNENENKELIRKVNPNLTSSESLEEFFRWFQRLILEDLELNKPQNLRLLTELWCSGQCDIEQRRLPSRLHIYLYMTQWKQNDLVKRCERDAAPGLVVAEKIETWLRKLYEVSLNSAKRSSLLILDMNSVTLLLQDCGINTGLCLSSFLKSNENMSGSPQDYVYNHDSERCFLASRHVQLCCEGSDDPEAKLTNFFEADLKELDYHVDPYLGVFDLIIQILLLIQILVSRITCGWIFREESEGNLDEVASCFAKKFLHMARGIHLPQERWIKTYQVKCRSTTVLLTVIEMWANGLFQANISAKVFIDILARLFEGDRDPTKWLEVVRSCGAHPDLVKEVSLKISKTLWEIQDRDIDVALALLRHMTPAEVRLVVSVEPGKLPNLREFLSILTDRQVTLDLYLLVHFYCLGYKESSDSYISLLCREGSQCKLRSFVGHLSPRGLRNLTAAADLTSLSLRTMDTSAVQELLEVTSKLNHLQTLKLIYDNKYFVVPNSSLDGSVGVRIINGIKHILTRNGINNLDFSLELPHLRNSAVNRAVNLISGLSKHYTTLIVGNLDHSGVKALLAGLDNNAVNVASLKLQVYVREFQGTVLFDLGRLPVPVPITDVIREVHNILRNPFVYLSGLNPRG